MELGNAWLRLGEREKAMRAYQSLIDQDKVPLAPNLVRELEEHIAMVRTADDPSRVEPMRNPWME